MMTYPSVVCSMHGCARMKTENKIEKWLSIGAVKNILCVNYFK